MHAARKEFIAVYCLRPGNCAIDVGAYVGGYTLDYLNLVGPKGRVIAYEPNPDPFSKMIGYLGGSAHLLARQKAVSDCSGKRLPLRICLGPEYAYNLLSTVEPIVHPSAETCWRDKERIPYPTTIIEVETEKLDDLQKEEDLSRLTLIKIDVEAHEGAVIEGARQILKILRPIIILEYESVEGKFECNSIEKLEELGYFCFDLLDYRRAKPGYRSLVTDLVALPEEHCKKFFQNPFLF